MKTWMFLAVGVLLAFMLALNGCGANFFACTTKASYNADGTWSYESCKNQENFKAKIGKDAKGQPEAEISTSASTPEAAIAAALQSQIKMQEQFGKLIDLVGPLISKGAAAGAIGATGGAAAPLVK